MRKAERSPPHATEETDLTYEGIETLDCLSHPVPPLYEETDLTYEGIETPDMYMYIRR